MKPNAPPSYAGNPVVHCDGFYTTFKEPYVSITGKAHKPGSMP